MQRRLKRKYTFEGVAFPKGKVRPSVIIRDTTGEKYDPSGIISKYAAAYLRGIPLTGKPVKGSVTLRDGGITLKIDITD
jgi:hypothetical protein